MIYLRQSTASQEVPLGYFVDSADGDTEKTALTIANTDIKVWKSGATALASKNSGGATHIANGIYYTVLDATDTDTIGPLRLFIHVAGALSVKVDCCVLDEAVYDVMFGTVAPATATNITAGTITTATNVTTVNGLAANVITAAAAAADFGTEVGTAVWAAGTRVLTAGTNIVLAKGTGVTGFNDLSAAQVNAEADTAIADAALATAANLATVAGYLDTEIAAILADTDELQSAWADGGRLDAILDARSAQASVDGLATDLATVDTVADAIKAKTDSLGFTVAGKVDANVLVVNGITVTGSGTESVPWGP